MSSLVSRRAVLASSAAAVAFSSAGAAETPVGYTNPVIRGMNPDPSVVRVGADYYCVTSSFEFFPGVPVYHSRDLINWRLVGYALDRPSQIAAISKPDGAAYTLFAATIRYCKGTFYVVTTNFTNQQNFYVTAKNPAGPWSEPVLVDQGVFDPSLFFDDDGKVYYTRRNRPGIAQAEIDLTTGKLTTPMKVIASGFNSRDCEGPRLYKFGGWYYLSVAEGGSRFTHMQSIGRSRSPWGPFEPDPNGPWLSQHRLWWPGVKTAGHAEIIEAHDGSWWATFLGTRHRTYDEFSLGRETFLVPMRWQDGWPVVDALLLRDLAVRVPTLPQHPWPAERESFDGPKLGLNWNCLGAKAAERFSLENGKLRLRGTPARLAFSPPSAFVGRRQTAWDGSVTSQVEFTPRDGEEAGVAVFMSPRFYYAAAVTLTDGKRCVVLRKRVDDMETLVVQPVAPGPVVFQIVMRDGKYIFSWRQDGEWHPLGEGHFQLIASEVAAVWTGMYLGMYAVSLHPDATPADFSRFDYVIA